MRTMTLISILAISTGFFESTRTKANAQTPAANPTRVTRAPARSNPTRRGTPATATRTRSRARTQKSYSPEAIKGAEALATIMKYNQKLAEQQASALGKQVTVKRAVIFPPILVHNPSSYSPPSYKPPRYGYLGLPGNYYRPSVASYQRYSPTNGVPTGGGFPVYSIDFRNPNGTTTTYAQSSLSQPTASNNLYYQAGYAGYTAPSAFYSYGSTYPTVTSPSIVGYTNNGNLNSAASNLVGPQSIPATSGQP